MKRMRVPFALWLILIVPSVSFGQGYLDLENQIVEHIMDNGFKLLILERHEAPVFSFLTYADVGGVNEEVGNTGLAHMFEHMAFKGTRAIGTMDYKKERVALEKVDQAFERLLAERRKRDQADSTRLAQLEETFKKAQEEAAGYVVSNEYGRIIEEAGGVGLNATTSSDATRYFYSLPSNKLELWAFLESDRMAHPVLREFYKERDVVMEERRMSESQPIGRLIEEFLALAYKGHPYGQPVIGHMSDLEGLTRGEAQGFYRTHYIASNMTAAVVGNIEAEEVIRVARKYFSKLPTGPKPPPVETIEPPQLGERRVVIEDPSQPLVIIGYHKPDARHPDDAVFDAITDIVGIGRTSRLYKSLVKEKKIALQVGAFPGFPGNKYPNLFVLYAFPAKGHTAEEMEEAIDAEIKRIKTELVSEEELKGVKTRTSANFIRNLRSNSGMASQLTFFEGVTGDWRSLFKAVEQINAVTPEDIQRVANEYFQRKNRTVGMLVTKEE